MNRRIDYFTALAVVMGAFGAMAVAGQMDSSDSNLPLIDRGAIECATDTECEALDQDTVMVGLGCEGGRGVEYAPEEDEFSGQCRTIYRAQVVGTWKSLVCRTESGRVTLGNDWKECKLEEVQ